MCVERIVFVSIWNYVVGGLGLKKVGKNLFYEISRPSLKCIIKLESKEIWELSSALKGVFLEKWKSHIAVPSVIPLGCISETRAVTELMLKMHRMYQRVRHHLDFQARLLHRNDISERLLKLDRAVVETVHVARQRFAIYGLHWANGLQFTPSKAGIYHSGSVTPGPMSRNVPGSLGHISVCGRIRIISQVIGDKLAHSGRLWRVCLRLLLTIRLKSFLQ